MSSELGVERPTTLPLPESRVERARHVHFSDVAGGHVITEDPPEEETTPSPKKPRQETEYRHKRKRSYSFSGPGEFRNTKKRKNSIVLPSKFLLGGSISDPLNLGSLGKEGIAKLGQQDSNAANASKRSDAVRVIIPPNINDPLNLDASSDNEETLTDALQKQLRRKRRRKRKRRLSEPGGSTMGEGLEGSTIEANQAEEESILQIKPSAEVLTLAKMPPVDAMKPLVINTEFTTPVNTTETRRDSTGPITPTGSKPSTSGAARTVFKKQRTKVDNKIVSPVIPQPGVERKRYPSHSRHTADKPHLSQQNLVPPKMFNPKNEHFQYGNYNKYYGYRNPDQTPDTRFDFFKRDWFEGKEVLDIGCNIGHITLTLARDFNPKRVVGMDIDKKLVNIAEKNIKHYMRKGDTEETNFPKSMRLLYGPLKPPVRPDGTRTFPYNVKFVHANYVLESDELLETVRPEFDLILCLSVTKWVHLNWGDQGLKRFFRRMFFNLRPGGRLLLEPQGWPSYIKKRKLTKRIFENYKSIRLFPEKFNDFLLHDVGFSTSEKMATPHHASRGFQRPIIVYTKAGFSTKPSPATASTSKGTLALKNFVETKEQKEEKIKTGTRNQGEKIIQTGDQSVSVVHVECQGQVQLNEENESKLGKASEVDDTSDGPPLNEPVEQQVLSEEIRLEKPNILEKANVAIRDSRPHSERSSKSVVQDCDASVCDTINTVSPPGIDDESNSATHSLDEAQKVGLPCTLVRNTDKGSLATMQKFNNTKGEPITPSDSSVLDCVSRKGNSEDTSNVRILSDGSCEAVISKVDNDKLNTTEESSSNVLSSVHDVKNKAPLTSGIIKDSEDNLKTSIYNDELANLPKCASPNKKDSESTISTSSFKRKIENDECKKETLGMSSKHLRLENH